MMIVYMLKSIPMADSPTESICQNKKY